MILLSFFLFSSFVIGVVYGNGEVNILSLPPSIDVRGHEIIDSNIVSNMMAAAVGFTTDHITSFQGMSFKDPWNLADSIVVVAIPGPKTLGLAEGHTFPLQDANMEAIRNSIESRMNEHNTYGENQTLVTFDLNNGKQYNEMMLNKGKLESKKQSDNSNLGDNAVENNVFADLKSQLDLMEAILNKFEKSDPPANSQPDLYWINIPALHPIIDIHGEDEVNEAKKMIHAKLLKTKDVFEKMYNKKTMVIAMTSDSVHTRRFRRASEIASDRNLAPEYDENYPVIFNIFLWFTIAFIMSLIAITMVTACMDPGRDSIIYRMTSTRMKKDN